MKLKEGLPILRRDRGTTQIGSDPNSAAVLTGLTPAEQLLLDSLEDSQHPSKWHECAQKLGIKKSRLQELEHALATVGVITSGQSGSSTNSLDSWWDRACHDRPSDRRKRKHIGVRSLDGLSLQIVRLLIQAGVRHFSLTGTGIVQTGDLQIYPQSDLGSARISAAHNLIYSWGGTTSYSADPDFELLVCSQAPAAELTQSLLHQDVAHLLVVVSETAVQVGPLVDPGKTPCLYCVELQRRDADPAWPLLSVQLQGKAAPELEPILSWRAAALAAQQILTCIDGRGIELSYSSWYLRAQEIVPTAQYWQPHPQCGCCDQLQTPQLRPDSYLLCPLN